MLNLPKLTDLDVTGKRVIVRADLDIKAIDFSDLRLQSLIPTLEFLKNKASKIIIIAHRGRPEGKKDEALSLRDFQKFFEPYNAQVFENLRFDPHEENNDLDFAKHLASLGECYVNEAFAASHREHASIVSLPKLLPHAAGLRFIEEVENLSKVFEEPTRPVIVIISGVKEDKVEMIKEIKDKVDKVLAAGRLPDYLGEDYKDEKVIVAKLNPDKEDITINSIEIFEKEIISAGTIVLAGVPGKYEDVGHNLGTERVFKAVVNSGSYKIAGGGDTEAALTLLGLKDKFNWISVGGGAMLEFLAKGTLPGLEALKV